MPDFEENDTSWRVGAIFRACVRYHLSREAASERLSEVLRYKDEVERLVDIWFREDPYFKSRIGYEAWRNGILDRDEVAGYRPSVIQASRDAWSDHEADRRAEIFLEENKMPSAEELRGLLVALTSPSSPAAEFLGKAIHCHDWINYTSQQEPEVALHYAFKLEAMSNRKLNVIAELEKLPAMTPSAEASEMTV